VRVEVVRPHELGPAQVERWHEFQHQDQELAHPFLSPEFARAVGSVRDTARVAVLEDGGEVVGFFPFERLRLGLGRPIGAGLSDCQGVVHRRGWSWRARELLSSSGLASWRFDHLVASQAPFAPYHRRVHESWMLDLSDGYDAYLASRRAASKTLVKTLERKARKLEREVGPLRLTCDLAAGEALRTLMAWKSDQYARTRAVDAFRDRSLVALLEHLVADGGSWCQALIYTLHAGERLAAVDLGLRSPVILSSWFPAYDPALALYGPGHLLLLRTAEAEARRGTALLDLGRGHEEYKPRYASTTRAVADGSVERPVPVGVAAAGAGLPRRVFRRYLGGTAVAPVLRRTLGAAAARGQQLRVARRQRGAARRTCAETTQEG